MTTKDERFFCLESPQFRFIDGLSEQCKISPLTSFINKQIDLNKQSLLPIICMTISKLLI